MAMVGVDLDSLYSTDRLTA